MAINLLGYTGNTSGSTSAVGAGPSFLSQLSAARNSIANKGMPSFTEPAMNSNFQIGQPMGVTAKAPTSNVPSPATSIPSGQQNPIKPVPVSTYASAPAAPQYDYNTGKLLAPGQQQSQYNTQTGQRIGMPQTQAAQTAQAQQQPVYQAPRSQQQPQQQAPTFSGLLSQAVNQQNSPYNQAAMQGINSLQQSAVVQNPNVQDSYNKAQGYNSQLQQMRSDVAAAQMANAGNAIPVQFQQGRAGAIQSQYGAQEQALADALQGETGLNSNANAQQTNIQSAENAAAGNALTGQSQIYGALQNAAQLAQPVMQYGSLTNPQTGQPLNPDAMAAAVALQVQKLQSGTTSPSDAESALSGYGQGGVTALQQAMGPNWNSNLAQGQATGQTALGAASGTGQASGIAAQAAAPGQANAQNMITGGTAAVNAGNSAYQQANPAYLKLANYTIPNIEGFGNLLTQGAGGINPFSSQYANMSLQQFQSQLSSQQQAQFQTTFQQLKQSIAELAGSGGSQTPTANSSQADATLSPNAKMSTIQSTLQRIAAEGNQYLSSQSALNNAALHQAQGGSQSTGNTSGSSISGFGWGG